jgi:hypothetical protein
VPRSHATTGSEATPEERQARAATSVTGTGWSCVGRVALIARGDPAEGRSFHLKRLVRSGTGIELRSDNPDVPSLPAEAAVQVIALLVKVLRPEDLAPKPGTRLFLEDTPDAFPVSATRQLAEIRIPDRRAWQFSWRGKGMGILTLASRSNGCHGFAPS